MKPATATIVREIRKFQKETGQTLTAISEGSGLSQPVVGNWLRGHCGSRKHSRKAVRKYMREYSPATSKARPKAREIAWDDEFVSAYQRAHAFKVEPQPEYSPGVLHRLVAPVRRLFSRETAA